MFKKDSEFLMIEKLKSLIFLNKSSKMFFFFFLETRQKNDLNLGKRFFQLLINRCSIRIEESLSPIKYMRVIIYIDLDPLDLAPVDLSRNGGTKIVA